MSLKFLKSVLLNQGGWFGKKMYAFSGFFRYFSEDADKTP